MIRKLGGALFLVGLFLPYGCGVRPISGAWDDLEGAVSVGVPMLAAVAYALHALVVPVARFCEQRGAGLHGLGRAVFLVLAGSYLGAAVRGSASSEERLAAVIALVLCGALLYWQQQRGSKAQRLPLLLLAIVGLPVVYWFVQLFPKHLEYGGWLVSAAFVVAVTAEVQALRAALPITHGG